jgi:hypothetical protein
LAAIAELRNEIQALDQQMHPEESNMPDDSNASLSPEERALIQQFRESHLSKAEQKAEFERIYNLPVSQWNKSDFDRMAGWLLFGNGRSFVGARSFLEWLAGEEHR